MMGSLSVQPEQVHSLADQIKSGAANILSALETLDSAVSALRSQWSGEAQETYSQKQDEWGKQIGAMQELLDRIAKAAHDMAGTYTSTDKKLATGFRAV